MTSTHKEVQVILMSLHISIHHFLRPQHQFLRSRGDVISADQVFPGPANPEYAQHPPNCAIDYWYYRLGLSLDIIPAETPSNFPILPSALPVFDDNDSSVRQSRHNTIYSQGVRICMGGLLIIQ